MSKTLMSESDLRSQVTQLAQILGWKVAYFRTAQSQKGWRTPVGADGKGWPDLVLLKGQKVLFRELKVGYNKPSEEQVRWLDDLQTAGQDARIWTDKDWPEAVMEELRGGSPAPGWPQPRPSPARRGSRRPQSNSEAASASREESGEPGADTPT